MHSGGTWGAYPEVPFEWPYLSNGLWSVLANGVFIVAGLGLAAWTVQRLVAEKTRHDVSFTAVFATLAVTGYAPVVAYPGLLPFNGILALVATAALVRWVALDRPRPPSRGRWRGAGFGLAAGAASAAVAYGVFHPLWFQAAVSPLAGRETTLHGERVIAYRPANTKLVPYEFSLQNAGFADVVVTGIELADRPHLIRLEGVREGPAPLVLRPASLRAMSHRRDEFVIPGRGTTFITMVLRIPGCRSVSATTLVDRVRVRYRVLGVERSAPVPLVPAPALRCP
ncbi:MAG TPA: hypothetical protein VG079_06210 [Gaiellaceae bacterium]|nr:hypothetical protein [Gaiellaceae bacterium]